MDLTKKLLYVLLAVLIFTIIMIVFIGKNGLIKQEEENYNQTHVEEMEDNKVIVQ